MRKVALPLCPRRHESAILPAQKHLPSTHCRNSFSNRSKNLRAGEWCFPLTRYAFKQVDSSWNVMAHGDEREWKWRGNWRLEWVASTLHTTSEHGVSSFTTADAHTSAASSRMNWRPRRFKWTRPFRRMTKSGFCACHHTSTGLYWSNSSPPRALFLLLFAPLSHPASYMVSVLCLCLRCVGNTPALLSCANILPKQRVCTTLNAKFKVLYISALNCYHLRLH